MTNKSLNKVCQVSPFLELRPIIMKANPLVTTLIFLFLPIAIARAHSVPVNTASQLENNRALCTSSEDLSLRNDRSLCLGSGSKNGLKIGQNCNHNSLNARLNGTLHEPNIDVQAAIIYNNQGVEKFKTGDDRGAIEAYDRAIAVNPKYGTSYVNRGIVKFKLGNIQAAIKDYNLAIAINSQDNDAYYNRGIAEFEAGQERAAIADFDRAIAIDPHDPEVYGNRGFAKSTIGDRGGAITDFQRAADLFRQQGQTQDYQRMVELIGKMSTF